MNRALVCAGLLFLTGVLPLAAQESGIPVTLSAPVISPEKGYFVQKLGGGLYWLTDGAYNTMFVVTSEGVIAIDPLPTLGPKYLKAIAGVTDKPVTYIVYSHAHADHIGGAHLFPKNVTIVAQKETAEILAARKDPHRPLPTVTFENHYTLKVGGETLELEYKGINHQRGNIFIYAPEQKVLMLVDVVYPGFMPYKNLGIAEDVHGYIQVHTDALGYDFRNFIGGHVNRLGTRNDVETSLEFVKELQATAEAALKSVGFPGYIQAHPAKDKWDLHNEYEKALVENCYSRLFPKWDDRLADTKTYLRDDCWAMIEAITVE